jgi:hypothetical protein
VQGGRGGGAVDLDHVVFPLDPLSGAVPVALTVVVVAGSVATCSSIAAAAAAAGSGTDTAASSFILHLDSAPAGRW